MKPNNNIHFNDLNNDTNEDECIEDIYVIEPHEEECSICGCIKNITDDKCSECGF
jgi:hypothetical protein